MASPTPDPGSGQGPMVPSRPINFSTNIDSPEDEYSDAITESVEREMPYDGVVSKVYIDIPNGVHSRAGFRIWDKNRKERMFPFDDESDWAAFNNVQDFWPVTFPLREGDVIEVEYINDDHHVDDPHLLKVWAIVVGESALPYDIDDLVGRDGVQL